MPCVACISIAVVYMLFVLGMFTKSCLFKCTQINCLVPLFSYDGHVSC